MNDTDVELVEMLREEPRPLHYAAADRIESLAAALAEMTKQRDQDVDRARDAEAEVERLRANALWLKDVADKRGEECDARLNKRPGANRA